MGKKFISNKEMSRRNWGETYETDEFGNVPDFPFDPERIKRGLAQRNADALEIIAESTKVMAKNYVELQNDAQMYKRWYNSEKSQKEEAERSRASLKGVITKQKNRIKELEAKLKAASASQNTSNATNG